MKWTQKKIRELDEQILKWRKTHELYGMDAIGYSAFSNIERMKELEQDIQKAQNKIRMWSLIGTIFRI